MPAQLRVLRRRIRSTRNIAQITKAMEMVATSRISKAQRRVEASRPYADEFTKVLQVASRNAATDHPLLVGREEPKRAGVLLITSDRGLNGGYNANAFREAERLTRELSDAGKEVVRFVIGGKGQSYYRFRRLEVAQAWGGFSEMPDFENASRVADSLTAAFLTGGEDNVSAPSEDDDSSSDDSRQSSVRVPEEAEGIPGVDELHIVYTEFKNMLSQIAVPRQLAPLPAQDEESDSGSGSGNDSSNDSGDSEESGGEYEFEPEAEELFDALLPRYLRARVFSALLDAAASESAQRRRAMKAATDNANELIDDLTREANQARQAQITQEISEIVGGAQALSGSGE